MYTGRKTIRVAWITLLFGLILVLLGIGIIMMPLQAYYTLGLIASCAFFICGMAEMITALIRKGSPWQRLWQLGGGVVNLCIAVILFPLLSPDSLSYLLGFGLLLRALTLFGMSSSAGFFIGPGRRRLFLLGLLSLILSFLLICDPLFTGLTIITFTAFSFIGLGIFTIIFGWQLRSIE
jgi:uncharacterized membrane protein HdeD (DUF308 family)